MENNKWDPSQCDPEVLKAFRKLCLIKIKELSERHAMEAFAQDPGPVSTNFYEKLRLLALFNRVPLLGKANKASVIRIFYVETFSDGGETQGSEAEQPRGKSPLKKKQKVSDSSMEIPTPAGAKQTTIDSYGKNGKNHGRYQKKKNPRNSIPENEDPIEVSHKYFLG